MAKRKTHVEFLKNIEDRFGVDTYELLSTYINSTTKITVKRIKCGHTWDAFPNSLLALSKDNYCSECNRVNKHNKFLEAIIKEGFTYISGNYINCESKYVLICPQEHHHNTDYDKFIYQKSRCQQCYFATASSRQRMSTDSVSNILSKEGYTLMGDYINKDIPIEIKCPNKHAWSVTLGNFKKDRRCPTCNQHKSKGEKEILLLLQNSNISYTEQYTFENCVYNSLLKFDFAIFNSLNDLLCLVEYDGEQHFKPVDFAGKGKDWAEQQFIETQKRDQIKNAYCSENDIPLLRIPFWEYDNIEILTKEFLKEIVL